MWGIDWMSARLDICSGGLLHSGIEGNPRPLQGERVAEQSEAGRGESQADAPMPIYARCASLFPPLPVWLRQPTLSP